MYILWISCFYHDSAAVLIKTWEIIAACQEERLTRIKHDSAFPSNAINYALKQAEVGLDDIGAIVYYEKPFIKFERLLETFLSEAPFWFKFFLLAVPIWLKEKLFLKKLLADEFMKLLNDWKFSNWLKTENWKLKIENSNKQLRKSIIKKLKFAEHHQSHSASAFYPSPFNDAAILTLDGVGEWTTTSLAYWKDSSVKVLKEIHFPHSLGLLYSAFTYYLGFKVNSWEYKVMWLAPYWEPRFVDLIKDNLIDIKEDWSFRLNMDYFNYTVWITMVNEKFEKLFNKKIRTPETDLVQIDMDIAASLQVVTEDIIILLARYAKKVTWSNNLCLAGWVALNCVANWKILREKIFDNLWIQPASWDAWGALGAALAYYFWEPWSERVSEFNITNRDLENWKDKMKWSYLWPSYTNKEVWQYLDSIKAVYEKIDNENELFSVGAKLLDEWNVIGWHQWRSEFWPRALGARSIIWDPRNKDMQSKMNLKIKYRESFRPFAPSVLAERASDYFDIDTISPYMLLVAPVEQLKRVKMSEDQDKLFWIEKLNIIRSEIPSVTHVDYSARIQTVHKETNPKYYWLIKAFEDLTWCALVVNTSFNVRGEPIVCTPEDSYKCFMRTEMDVLIIEDFILYKNNQPEFNDKEDWKEKFELD